MRNGLKHYHLLIWFFLLLPLSSEASITFRIYTAGPQAGEIHIDSPQGSFLYFRPDAPEEQVPPGFCGMRWAAPADEMVWYWGNPGRLLYLPANGIPAPEISYQLPYSTCANGKNVRRFDTPSTPEGSAPADAQLLVVEVPGWHNVSFIDHRQGRLPTPGSQAAERATDICQRYPGFCLNQGGQENIINDPCRYASGNDLVCQILPGMPTSLTRIIDLTSSMAYLQKESEESCTLHLYRRGGKKKIRSQLYRHLSFLGQIQSQFRQTHASYRRISQPLQRMNSHPFSHYTYATSATQLDLAEVWLLRCQQQLRQIEAALDSKSPWQPKQDFNRLEQCRRNAASHLQEAKFWLERQHAWVVPMER